MIGRLVKFLVVLAVLGAIGLAGYAVIGDLSPETETITQAVTLDAD